MEAEADGVAITYHEFNSRVGASWLAFLRRAATENALDIRPWLVRRGQEAEPPFVIRGQRSPEEQYVQRLSTITTEVLDSFAAMRHVEVYLSRFAFAKRGIPASAYIRFHLESFLNETYILRERLKAFARKFGQEWRGDFSPKEIKTRVTYSRKEVDRLFEPLNDMRGGHVHRSRYIDTQLAQLVLWETAVNLDAGLYKDELRRCATAVRKLNRDFVKGINDGLEGKLDRFFNYYAGVAFKESGELRYPSEIRDGPSRERSRRL